MKKVTVSLSTFFLLSSVFLMASVLNIQPVKASGTIFIRADGSIDPPTAPIATFDNVTYTQNAAVFESIVIEKNNTVFDGAGYVIQGTGNGTGIYLLNSNNVTLKKTNIQNFEWGIQLDSSSGNLISENALENNTQGISASYSSGNNIFGNNITNNTIGIWLESSPNNTIFGCAMMNNFYGVLLIRCADSVVIENNATNSEVGLKLFRCSGINISGNNMVNNTEGIWLESTSNTIISENVVTGTSVYGISLDSFSSNNTITENRLSDNGYGIFFDSSFGNNVSRNTLWFNFVSIWLVSSSNNTIYGNSVAGFYYSNGFGVKLDHSSDNIFSMNALLSAGFSVADSYENVVENNLVNHKPLVYLENASNVEVGPDAGQVILVNCNQIRVHDLDLSHTDVGIELWRTNDTWIFGNNISANSQYGIWLNSSYDNLLSENEITNNMGAEFSVWLEGSSNNYLARNNVTNNFNGIRLSSSSSFNTFLGNRIMANDMWDIFLFSSSFNVFGENEISSSRYGVEVWNSSGNSFHHNNFDFNTQQVVSVNSTSAWDDGYPNGGNYWSDYSGPDIKSGPFQNETSFDWIGDSPYVIDENNTDQYPLMWPFSVETSHLELAYRGLLINVHELNSELVSLNATDNDLVTNFTTLQGKYDLLEMTVSGLQDKIIFLDSTVQGLKSSLDSTTSVLNTSINNLQSQLNNVNSTLQASINNLQDQNTAMNNQLNNILSVLYFVIGIAVISAISTIYLVVKRPKTPREST